MRRRRRLSQRSLSGALGGCRDVGAQRFDRFLANPNVRRCFDGASPAAIGAILGCAVPLSLALRETWQWAVLAGACALLFLTRRGVVLTLLVAGTVVVAAALPGAPPDV